jgi:hypothetical protein
MAFEGLGEEYDAVRAVFQLPFPGATEGVLGLKKVLGADGPERSHAESLEHFRTVTLKFKATDKILESSGLDPAGKNVPTEDAVKRAASLKFLRHLYMVSARGNQEVWVLTSPKTYSHYPLAELMGVKTSNVSIKAKIEDIDERFGVQTRTQIGEATMMGLRWCEAAKVVLATAKTDTKAMAKVKRWFADGSTSANALAATISDVHKGFKKVANTLNGHRVMVTDMPSLRLDPNQELTEAFILNISGKTERPRTIYIEKALFENYNVSVLHDMKKNWARTLVHECTHIDAGTLDKGYAWAGIEPGVDLPVADAAVNADSWAFFAADCANALTAGEIVRTCGGTGGDLTKLAKNWN